MPCREVATPCPSWFPSPIFHLPFDGSVILSLQIIGHYSQSCYYILLMGGVGNYCHKLWKICTWSPHSSRKGRFIRLPCLMDADLLSSSFLFHVPPAFVSHGVAGAAVWPPRSSPEWDAVVGDGDGGWVSAGGCSQRSWALLSHLCVWVCVHVQTARTSLFLFGRSVSKVYFVRAGQAPVSTLLTKSS